MFLSIYLLFVVTLFLYAFSDDIILRITHKKIKRMARKAQKKKGSDVD